MSTPAVTAALIEHTEHGYGSAGPGESQTTKVDVTISGAPDTAKGANGEYSLHEKPLYGQNIRYYQGIKGDSFHMFIIYDEKKNQWLITSDKGTPSETKIGVVAYIACDPQDARTTYLQSVSGKRDWFIKSSDSSKADYKDLKMVAIVHSGGESTAAASESSESSPAAAHAATSSPVAVSASPVAAPSVVVTAPTVTEMKKIITNISAQYNNVYGEYIALTSKSPDTDWSNFKTKTLDKATADLKEALAKLDALKKAGSGSSASSPTPTSTKISLIDEGMVADRDASLHGYDAVGGSSSSSAKSKKNRKSHKSYHPGIGKTRKHHSHSEPKRVSFVHQA